MTEIVMYEPPYDFMVKHEILYELQFGFRASHSVNNAPVSQQPSRTHHIAGNLVVEYLLICKGYLIQ